MTPGHAHDKYSVICDVDLANNFSEQIIKKTNTNLGKIERVLTPVACAIGA